MHGFLPTGFFEQYINKGQWYAVPLAVAMGIPMYSNAAGVIPVVQVSVSYTHLDVYKRQPLARPSFSIIQRLERKKISQILLS